MTIEKTFKLTIKDTTYLLTEEEVSALYTECGKALKISVTNPNWPTYPPGVRKFDPLQPTDYPSWPWGTPTYYETLWDKTTGKPETDWHTNISANVKSSNGINFLSDDKDIINRRSSLQQSLDKIAKTNDTTSGGTNIR